MTNANPNQELKPEEAPEYRFLSAWVNFYSVTDFVTELVTDFVTDCQNLSHHASTLQRNLIYFHGFSQHDGNFELARVMGGKLLMTVSPDVGVQAEQLAQLKQWLENQQAAQLDSAPLDSESASKLLVTVSIDSSAQGVRFDQVVPFLDVVRDAKAESSDLVAFSYGALLAQAYLHRLPVGETHLLAADELTAQLPPANQSSAHQSSAHSSSSHLSSAHRESANLFKRCMLICGSVFPFGKYSIEERIAKRTLELWNSGSLVAFGQLMGFDEEKMAPLRAAMANGLSTLKQKHQLLYFHKSLMAFNGLLDSYLPDLPDSLLNASQSGAEKAADAGDLGGLWDNGKTAVGSGVDAAGAAVGVEAVTDTDKQASEWTHMYSRTGDRFYSLKSQQALAQLLKPQLHKVEAGPHYVSPYQMLSLLVSDWA